MKAKTVINFLLAALAFFIGVIVPNEVATHFQHDAVGTVVTGMAVVNFANLDGQCFQTPNPGGLRKVYRICSAFITGNWPNQTVITGGEITALPTLVGTNKFSVYEFPDGTAEVTSDSNGDPSYQSFKHGVELAVAGFSKTIQNELIKDLNAGSVVIVEMNDGQLVVAGSSDNPIYFKKSFKGGKKGSDKRGFTLKGEQDGFMWDLLPLASSIAATLPVQTAA